MLEREERPSFINLKYVLCSLLSLPFNIFQKNIHSNIWKGGRMTLGTEEWGVWKKLLSALQLIIKIKFVLSQI